MGLEKNRQQAEALAASAPRRRAAADPQVRENGYIARTATADGTEFELSASPVQFDNAPTATRRAPAFNEHGDDLLKEIGLDMEQILELKAAGAGTGTMLAYLAACVQLLTSWLCGVK